MKNRCHQPVRLQGVSDLKPVLRSSPLVALTLLISAACLAAEKGDAESNQGRPKGNREAASQARNVQSRDFTTVTRDAEGRITVEKTDYDSDQDGNVDRSRIVTFTYAEGGRLSKKTIEHRDAEDSLIQRETYTFEYDDRGLLVEETMTRDDGDNSIDATMTQSFSYVNGRLDTKTTEHDENADGKVDRREQTSFVYSPDGKLIREVVDTRRDSDEKVALRVENRFDYEDNRLALKSTEADVNANGSVDRHETVRYKEPLGSIPSVEETEIDADADGVVDQRRTVVHGFSDRVEQESARFWFVTLAILLVLTAFLVYLRMRSNAKKNASHQT